MLEVRKALKNTKWGKLYLLFLWGGNLTLVILSFLTTNNPPFSILVGYFTMMFMRAFTTLKATIELAIDIQILNFQKG